MAKRNILRLFESRKGHLDDRIKRDFVKNGITTIPCRITDFGDVIAPYSVQGHEALNTELIAYLQSAVEVTPPECPLVLNIIEDCLTQDEKRTISEIIRDEFAYHLGMVEKDEKRHKYTFCLTFFGVIISGVLLWLTEALADVPREMFHILFCFMAGTLFNYIFLSGYDLRRARRLAGRLASIKVVFSEAYGAPNYSEKDLEKLYSEIEKDVYETIQEAE